MQLCPKARQLIKHLVADGRYDYIETGSLITGLLMTLALGDESATSDDLYKAVFTGDVYFNSGMIAENAVAQSFAMSGRPLFFYSRRNPESHRNELKIDFLIRRNGYSGRIEFYRSHQHSFISALKKHLLWATAQIVACP